MIHNVGKVYKIDRKLVRVNENIDNPRLEAKVITIPDVAPNKYIKIATNFEARSIKEKYTCEWEMQDSQGTACFGMNAGFNVIINLSYETNTEG